MQKILANRIRCRYCGDIVESKSPYEMQFCRCGRVAANGGRERLGRISVYSRGDYEELSIFEENQMTCYTPKNR